LSPVFSSASLKSSSRTNVPVAVNPSRQCANGLMKEHFGRHGMDLVHQQQSPFTSGDLIHDLNWTYYIMVCHSRQYFCDARTILWIWDCHRFYCLLQYFAWPICSGCCFCCLLQVFPGLTHGIVVSTKVVFVRTAQDKFHAC
jgi:hypothetical protein